MSQKMWSSVAFNQLYAEPSRNGLTRPKKERGNGYKMINMGEIFAHGLLRNPPMDLVPLSDSEKVKYAVKTGDLLFARRSLVAAGAGKCSIVLEVPELTTFESSLIRVRLDPEKASSLFYYYYFASSIGRANVRPLVMQVAVAGIRGSELAQLPVPIPPIDVQHKIGSTLLSIDDSIQKSEEIIIQTQRLKKGLMQRLLTRGIGHTSFKQTEISEMPKKWQVYTLEDACLDITDGSHWSPKGAEPSDYRIATVANLKDNYIDVPSCKTISEDDYARLSREGDVPRDGDILFSKDGTVGLALAFKQTKENIAVLSSIAIIRPNPKILDPEFGAYALTSPSVRSLILGKKTGTALRRIILRDIRKVSIPVPPIAEQQEIATIFLIVDRKIETETERKMRLKELKNGLMNDLLTGKKGVKVT